MAKPWLGEEEATAVQRVLASGWITQGPEVAAFEREFANFVGAEYACAVSSCTTALHLALLAAGVGEGDEVITVSHTFIATANAIRYCGAVPVFVDVDPSTFNMDPDLIEPLITEKTKAILCVHQIGMPCDVERIVSLARKHDLFVIEDAACAIGSEIRVAEEWERIGRPHGDVACFSFHPRKILTTGDGGMITTQHQDWDRKFRLWRQHGMGIPDTVRHDASRVVFESYDVVGYNYRMTDLQAAVGRVQLMKVPEMVKKRREQVCRYTALLADSPNLTLPNEPPYARSNWQSYCVCLSEWTKQREVMQKMLDAGIATRRGIMNIHMESAYQDVAWKCGGNRMMCGCQADSCRSLPHSEELRDRCMILPLYHELRDRDLKTVADILRNVLS